MPERLSRMTFRRSFLYAALALAALAPAAGLAQGEGAQTQGFGSDWESWRAGNSVTDVASLQRGARNFLAYCNGCHSLKYERYSRLATDLEIPTELFTRDLLPADRKSSDYISTPMSAHDAEAWFGKAPPDLSLIARSRGPDYLYRYLTTYYADPSRPTGANNLAYDTTAMPDVLSDLEGLKRAVFKNVEERSADGKTITEKVFDHFETLAPGSMTREQFDGFVRDIVNFLDYVGEPKQAYRRAIGVWVVLFLLVFTGLAWLLKKEYWKNVH